MTYAHLDSPLGPLLVVARRAGGLSGLYLPGQRDTPALHSARSSPSAFAAVARQLDEYFAGRRRAFELRLDLAGTAFQVAVWRALRDVPFGATRSYGELARALGRPAAFRAVGAANGRNPISILVPCHRLVGASGALTGYGGGLPAKRWLLAHERGVASLRRLSDPRLCDAPTVG